MIKVFFSGNLGAEPQTREVGSTHVCSFNVAVRTDKKNKETNQYETEWINVSVWGAYGEMLAGSLHKGMKICGSGSLTHRSYVAQDGSTRFVTDVRADSIDVMSPKQAGTNNEAADTDATVENDDELPF